MGKSETDAKPAQEKRTSEAAVAPEAKKAKVEFVPETDEKKVQETRKTICDDLKEENESLVEMIVKTVGTKLALEMLEKTKEIEKGEGIQTADGERRKTPGGVFLHLSRDMIGRPRFNVMCQEDHKRKRAIRKSKEYEEGQKKNSEKEEAKPEEKKEEDAKKE